MEHKFGAQVDWTHCDRKFNGLAPNNSPPVSAFDFCKLSHKSFSEDVSRTLWSLVNVRQTTTLFPHYQPPPPPPIVGARGLIRRTQFLWFDEHDLAASWLWLKQSFSSAIVGVYKSQNYLTAMNERICRETDENLYQPKIHSERIRSLYQIKLATGIPLTVLLDMAIAKFLEDQEKKIMEQPTEYGERNTNWKFWPKTCN